MTVANPGQQQSASTQAITALVLGILGLICCNILGPVAWYLGSQELKAIREGRSPFAGEILAKIGMILGIFGTIFLVLGVLWLFFMGGLAVLQGIAAANS
jgi:Domain of unknown function (DUF4190)